MYQDEYRRARRWYRNLEYYWLVILKQFLKAALFTGLAMIVAPIPYMIITLAPDGPRIIAGIGGMIIVAALWVFAMVEVLRNKL